MKQFITYNFIALLLQASTPSNAQTAFTDAYDIAVDNQESVPITATLFINEHPSKKEQFTSEWVTGTINFSDSTKATNCNLRYNCWKDELIWLRDTDYKTGTVLKSSVKSFTLNTSPNAKHFTKYIDEKSVIKQVIYLEALAEGKISLYCHRKVTYIKSSNAFTNNHQYYLGKDGSMIKIKICKSDLLKQFSEDQQKQLKQILHENHLKFKNEYNLAKALDIYNETVQ